MDQWCGDVLCELCPAFHHVGRKAHRGGSHRRRTGWGTAGHLCGWRDILLTGRSRRKNLFHVRVGGRLGRVPPEGNRFVGRRVADGVFWHLLHAENFKLLCTWCHWSTWRGRSIPSSSPPYVIHFLHIKPVL